MSYKIVLWSCGNLSDGAIKRMKFYYHLPLYFRFPETIVTVTTSQSRNDHLATADGNLCVWLKMTKVPSKDN